MRASSPVSAIRRGSLRVVRVAGSRWCGMVASAGERGSRSIAKERVPEGLHLVSVDEDDLRISCLARFIQPKDGAALSSFWLARPRQTPAEDQIGRRAALAGSPSVAGSRPAVTPQSSAISAVHSKAGWRGTRASVQSTQGAQSEAKRNSPPGRRDARDPVEIALVDEAALPMALLRPGSAWCW